MPLCAPIGMGGCARDRLTRLRKPGEAEDLRSGLDELNALRESRNCRRHEAAKIDASSRKRRSGQPHPIRATVVSTASMELDARAPRSHRCQSAAAALSVDTGRKVFRHMASRVDDQVTASAWSISNGMRSTDV